MTNKRLWTSAQWRHLCYHTTDNRRTSKQRCYRTCISALNKNWNDNISSTMTLFKTSIHPLVCVPPWRILFCKILSCLAFFAPFRIVFCIIITQYIFHNISQCAYICIYIYITFQDISRSIWNQYFWYLRCIYEKSFIFGHTRES